MAAIYFVREGNGPDVVTGPQDVPIELVSEKLRGRELEYSAPAPKFNATSGNTPSSANHVIVETFDGEVCETCPGYYYVVGMTPDECRRMFSLS